MPNPTLYNEYTFDPLGTNPNNLITGEQQILTGANGEEFYYFIPALAPFFKTSMTLSFRATDGSTRPLIENIDFWFSNEFISASRACAAPIFGSIQILDPTLTGVVTLQYQTLGGIYPISQQAIAEILADLLLNPRITAWEQVTNYPYTFPVIEHAWDLQDLVGASEVVNSLDAMTSAVIAKTAALQSLESQPGSYSRVVANLQINAALANLGALPANLGTLQAGFLDGVAWTHNQVGGVGSINSTPTSYVIDFLEGNSQSITVTGPVNFSFTNLPAINKKGFIYLDLYNGGTAAVNFTNVNWLLPNQTTTTSFATYLSQMSMSLNAVGPNFFVFWTSGVTANQVFGRFI